MDTQHASTNQSKLIRDTGQHLVRNVTDT